MKNQTLLANFILSMGLVLFMSSSSFATKTVDPVTSDETIELATAAEYATAPAVQKQNWLQKKWSGVKQGVKRVKAKIAKFANIDFQDDTKKWMWFWILGWAAGIVLSILGIVLAVNTGGISLIFNLIGGLCWLFGSIALIIWLIKLFA